MWSLPQTSGLGRKKDLVQVAWLHVRGLRWRGFTSRELRWRGFTSRGLGDTRLLETSAELRSQGQGGEPPAGCEQSHDSGELQGGCGPGFRSPLCKAGDVGLIPGSGRHPWRRAWLPAPVFLPGESHGQRSLAGCGPWGCKDADRTEQLHSHGTMRRRSLRPRL